MLLGNAPDRLLVVGADQVQCRTGLEPCPLLFVDLEYKHNMKISLVEDESAHVNQFWMYDKNNEDITDLYNFV